MDKSEYQIIITEDDAILLKMVKEILTNEGYENLTCFSDPLEAKAYLEKSAADVVVSDYCMPGINGLQLLESLGHRRKCRRVLMTASPDEHIAEECEKNGTILVTKPFRVKALAAAVLVDRSSSVD